MQGKDKKKKRRPRTFEFFEDSDISSSGRSAAETENNSYITRKKTLVIEKLMANGGSLSKKIIL